MLNFLCTVNSLFFPIHDQSSKFRHHTNSCFRWFFVFSSQHIYIFFSQLNWSKNGKGRKRLGKKQIWDTLDVNAYRTKWRTHPFAIIVCFFLFINTLKKKLIIRNCATSNQNKNMKSLEHLYSVFSTTIYKSNPSYYWKLQIHWDKLFTNASLIFPYQ